MIQKSQWNKGGLSAKLYTLVVRNVVRLAKNAEENADNRGDFEYKETLRRISALGWSTDLRQLPGLNFIQLYDYLFVSTSKYRHIVLKDTNYKKLKSYQFFFERNVERLESKILPRQDLCESDSSSIYEEEFVQSYSRVLTSM